MFSKKTAILAGIGALAYYLYTRLDEEQKDTIVKGIKDQLNKTIEQFMPRNSKANFETRMDMQDGSGSAAAM
jgi:hypothetical protein